MPPPGHDPRIEIDAGIAGLIRECWRLGLKTRYCCQGDATADDATGLAYIAFADLRSAALFAALAGPMSWSERTHKIRDRETHHRREPWRWAWWQWALDQLGCVRFPSRDIPRAEAALASVGVRIGSDRVPSDPILSAPERRCPICTLPVTARRRDATYCSRRCRLAARRRSGREKKTGG
jgi:hypothetical protein